MRTKPIPETAAFGIDIGKKVFHIIALNGAGAIIQRAKFSRDKLIGFFETAPKALVGMEACPGAQWLARRLARMGHDARIIPARFVKPYVKSNKTDTVDAAAIAEAVTRPTMRFVEVRTLEQVDLQALHRIRDRLVGQRTGLMNQARAFCIEYGLAMRVGAGGFHADIRRHLANEENDLTSTMRVLLDDLGYIESRIKAVTGKVEAYARENDTVSRLVTIPGISKRGNRYVRRLIIHGARSCFLHLNRANHALGGWLSALEARTHRNKAVVALANKLTRIVWAVLTKPGSVYLQSKGAARS